MTLDDRIATNMDRLRPAERRVALYFQRNREKVLFASAAALADDAGTSDATVIRATRAMGYAGLADLRRSLAQEMRRDVTLTDRLESTLATVEEGSGGAFGITLDIHTQAIDRLRQDITPDLFARAVDAVTAAARVFVFGIGPSGAMADYFAIQLCRLGVSASAMTRTGLLLADDLHKLRAGDLVVILAYGRVYREVSALVGHTAAIAVPVMLITDTLGSALRDRVDMVLPVARGRAKMFSMHTATLALMEALLVGVAAKRPADTIAALERLKSLRSRFQT